MINTSEFVEDNLVKLIQPSNFIGWLYSIDYENALVITNDDWKSNAKGIPHNCFLLAASFRPDEYGKIPEEDKEVILLRVIGSCKLPQDDDMIRTKIDNYQNKTGIYNNDDSEFDNLTRNRLQFSGLECRVLGTFYMKEQELNLGSDIESFSSSLQTRVYIPKDEALEKIVNFIDPVRKKRSVQDFKELGIEDEVKPFSIGTVRYTSTDRLHRGKSENKVKFSIQPTDFLARRTAVLGMTRTGKSNMIKQTVSVVKNVSDQHRLKIGQLIFDINGEYANANIQDKGSISEIFKGDCIKYRMIKTEGFGPLLNNFYIQLEEGLSIIRDLITEARRGGAEDIENFLGISLEKPDEDDYSNMTRWHLKISLYKTLLMKAGYEYQGNFAVKFKVNSKIVDRVNEILNSNNDEENNDVNINPYDGMDFRTAESWFLAARKANNANKEKPILTSSKNNWLDNDCIAMLNLLAEKNSNDSYIRGYKTISIAKEYHTNQRSEEVYAEIYNYLKNGKIVILDLSVGNAMLRERISKNIAKFIFNASMNIFTEGKTPPNIVIYIEEAHNLIGQKMALTETWPRLAKEGAKYKIALVYATQEVSSVHKNILANTENWFVSHLNSDTEVKELAHFYDFSDFSKSLLRSQDVGFTRVKTLSSPFVIPVQIDLFDPSKFIKQE